MKAKIGIFFAALLLVVGYSGVYAQKGVRLGFIAQPLSTWMLNKDDMNKTEYEYTYEKTWGMSAGPTVGYNFTDNLGLRFNLIYSNQGQNWKTQLNDTTWIHHTQRLGYLKMPLMFGYNSSVEFKKIGFSIYGGFQGAVRLKSRYYNDDQSYTPDEVYFGNVINYPSETKQYSWFNFGPVVQGGLDVKLTYSLVASAHIRADYDLGDSEFKDARFQRMVSGVPVTEFIYPADRAKTHNVTGGLMLGITYFIPEY